MSDALLEDLKLLYAHEIKRSKNPEFLIDLLRRIAFLTAERDQYKDRCEQMQKPVQHLFESHCLNTGHRTDQTCPICYEFIAARVKEEKTND